MGLRRCIWHRKLDMNESCASFLTMVRMQEPRMNTGGHHYTRPCKSACPCFSFYKRDARSPTSFSRMGQTRQPKTRMGGLLYTWQCEVGLWKLLSYLSSAVQIRRP